MDVACIVDNLGTTATPAAPAPTTCCAIVQEGPRRGATCRFPPSADNAYCGRHQRNRIYDEGVAAGKIWCRLFFRGCDNATTKPNTACDSCKAAKATAAAAPCAHDGCKNRAKESSYCGKHKRDELLTSGIAYCDVARGCLNICEPGRSSCAACLEKQRIKDNKRYAELKTLHTTVAAATAKTGTNIQVCCYCGKDFAPFKTAHGKQSRACPACRANQQKQDAKRVGRVRNYKNELLRNQHKHFKQYFRNAVKRDFVFELTIEEFTELVCSPCYYCQHKKADEVNGIDRYDNLKGYTKENCRPCCEECNRMKLTYDPAFFVERAKLITAPGSATPEFFTKWSCYYTRSAPANYLTYKLGAESRSIDFMLNEKEFFAIISQPCYLCGFKGNTGIDRRDSRKGYTVFNCASCCKSCNLSKNDIDIDVFYEKNKQIAAHFSEIPAPLVVLSDVGEASIPVRKHWKAASLYDALLTGREQEFIADQPPDIVSVEELKALQSAAATQPEETVIAQLKRFLATVSKRKKRATADTIQHIA